jgi:uncharacterized protein YndB with AHSA1/START domain
VIDVTHEINAVARQVKDREFQAGEARSVVVARTYDTTVDDLWDACTTAERIERWLTPVTGDLELGGRYQLEGNAGGEITACDPPHAFEATWEFGDAVTWIEVRITDAGDAKARLEIEHIARVEAHWDEFGPGAVGIGWDLALVGLGIHLGGGGDIPYAELQAWMASEEARDFMAGAGESWREADVASGTDPDEAKRRSDNTITAYTAPPEAPEG